MKVKPQRWEPITSRSPGAPRGAVLSVAVVWALRVDPRLVSPFGDLDGEASGQRYTDSPNPIAWAQVGQVGESTMGAFRRLWVGHSTPRRRGLAVPPRFPTAAAGPTLHRKVSSTQSCPSAGPGPTTAWRRCSRRAVGRPGPRYRGQDAGPPEVHPRAVRADDRVHLSQHARDGRDVRSHHVLEQGANPLERNAGGDHETISWRRSRRGGPEIARGRAETEGV